MAVTFVGATTAVTETNELSVTVPIHANVANGDYLVAVVTQGEGAVLGQILTATGWAKHNQHNYGGTDFAVALFTKIHQDDVSYVFDSTGAERWAVGVMAFSGVGSVDAISTTPNLGSDAAPIAPALTASVDNCMVVRMYGADDGTLTSEPPAGTTEAFDIEQISGASAGGAYAIQATAGSTGTAQFTLTTSDNWVGYTAVLAPAGPALDVPQNVVGVATGGTVDLSWDAVTGASSYDIERDGVIIAVRQAGTTYSDEGLSDGEYTYRVRAVQ